MGWIPQRIKDIKDPKKKKYELAKWLRFESGVQSVRKFNKEYKEFEDLVGGGREKGKKKKR